MWLLPTLPIEHKARGNLPMNLRFVKTQADGTHEALVVFRYAGAGRRASHGL